MSLFIVLLEGALSHNPPVRKSAFQPFDHFLIQPLPFVATLVALYSASAGILRILPHLPRFPVFITKPAVLGSTAVVVVCDPFGRKCLAQMC